MLSWKHALGCKTHRSVASVCGGGAIYFYLFILREREREHKWGLEQRQRERESHPGSVLLGAEPDVGLELMNHEIMA